MCYCTISPIRNIKWGFQAERTLDTNLCSHKWEVTINGITRAS
jgi:hypothetical protein